MGRSQQSIIVKGFENWSHLLKSCSVLGRSSRNVMFWQPSATPTQTLTPSATPIQPKNCLTRARLPLFSRGWPSSSSSSRRKERWDSGKPNRRQLAFCSSSRIAALTSGVGEEQKPSSTPLGLELRTATYRGFPLSLRRRIVMAMASKSSGWGAKTRQARSFGSWME